MLLILGSTEAVLCEQYENIDRTRWLIGLGSLAFSISSKPDLQIYFEFQDPTALNSSPTFSLVNTD